jgi:hypothetical protein
MKKTIMTISKIFLLIIFYALIVPLISGIMISIGFDFPNMDIDEKSSFLQLLFAGFLCSIFVIYLSYRYVHIKKWNFFFIVFSILFLSNISVAIEGILFTPELITYSVFFTLLIQQLLISLLYSYLSILIIKRKKADNTVDYVVEKNKQNISNLLLKLVLCGLIYMTMYYFWGWLNYNLFTKPSYDLGISGLYIPSTLTLIKSIFFRGILITISIVPFLLSAQPNSKIKMFETGTILFVFGGLLPFSLTFSMFPFSFIVYSLVEILLQNFLTGIIIYNIYRMDKLLPTIIRV